MKTDDLIQNLSNELKPVQTIGSPLRTIFIFTLIGMVLIGLGFLIMSCREDLRSQFLNPQFLFEIGLSFLLALAALALATFLSRPGHESETRKLVKATVFLLIVAFLYDGFRIAQLSQEQIHVGLDLSGLECFICVFGYAVVLGAALLFWLRNGASTKPNLSGLVIGTACVTLGNVFITFFCGSHNGMHILVWHLTLPMTAALAVGFAASRFLLKW